MAKTSETKKDEKILKALDHKEITQNALIDAVKAAL